ncbi:Fe-S cluster assembly sulfur transfer protein SufU [Candidatus Phytoplasma sp. AldY-WA1]|uniref:Fe-S cluster assembly sulfur transfer protein SufU n=1 Tax=Candidatus Phytoplasma sp. AldY-WA1 TaxID=2852100 RepID=UPI0025501395|nr:SUF system NifU family Fe-S cluster assembly protein [Candidatus Phytoplasma sp. AldY-WA1]
MNQLYRDLIIKHYRNPFNKGLIKNNELIHYCVMKEKNISCSDEIILQVKFENKDIVDIKYEVQGCAILTASASLMSIYLKKNDLILAIKKIKHFCNMLKNEIFDPQLLDEELLVFETIKDFPGRFKCASMPWKLLLQMINIQ